MNFDTIKDLPAWEWPENAGDIFLNVALDKEQTEHNRSLAIRYCGDIVVVDDAMVHSLLGILQDERDTEIIRAEAAISLGPVLEYTDAYLSEDADRSISDAVFNRIQEIFFTVYHDGNMPKEIRRRVLEASVRAPCKWHFEAVKTAYLEADQDLKMTAVFCMGYIDGFEEELAQAVHDENPAIRNEAVKALQNIQEMDFFDVDDDDIALPDESEIKDPFVLSALKEFTHKQPVPSEMRDKPEELSDFKSNDDLLDELYNLLTDNSVPWDDEIMGFDIDEDPDSDKDNDEDPDSDKGRD